MIHFYSAHSLNTLAPVFAEKLLQNQKQNDPFAAPWIIVQNKETETWLHSKVAKENKISANLDFILPNQFVFKLYRMLDEKLPKVLPSDRMPMQWQLLSLFKNYADKLATFGLNIPDSIDAKIALAEEIADVFDLYQIYRPKMLSIWESRSFDYELDHWQVGCWQLLTKVLKKNFADIPLRSTIPTLLIDSIKKGKLEIPSDIFVVGISHWNQSFNDLMVELSEKATIHWVQQAMVVPDSVLPITKSWKQPQDEIKKSLISSLKNRSLDFKIHSIDGSEPTSAFIKNDITLHSCHNPKREVEVLYQELLRLLNDDPALIAEDLLIMVPDLEEYLPHIETVFSDPKAETKLPVQVLRQRFGNPEEVFLKLLKFYSEGEKVTHFLDVIASKPIRTQFRITDDLLIYVEKWFEEMKIHNGLRESDSDYCIEKGIEQLFEGLLLKMPAFELYQKHVPYSLPLKSDAFFYVSQLHSIYRAFAEVKLQILEDKSVSQWLESAIEWCSKFMNEASGVKKLLLKLKDETSLANFDELLSFDVFKKWISEQLTSNSASATQFGTGIQISSYIPYRNIPFKFTAILGLNEGVFPRNPSRPNFDLIHNAPQPGDRIVKNDDQLLFLERLLSTDKHVYISYIGEGENGSLVSPIVQQLKDSSIIKEEKKHNLHAFEESINSKAAVFGSTNTYLAKKIIDDSKDIWNPISSTLPSSNESEISLKELISFYVDPAKYLCTNKLGIQNVYEDNLLDDRQLFKLDGLNKYRVRQQIEQAFTIKEMSEIKSYLTYKGELPKGFNAEKTFTKECQKIEKMVDYIHQKYPESFRREHVDFRLGTFRIMGTILDVNDHTLVKSQISAVKGKHIIQLWIEFLIAQICLKINSAELIAFNKDDLVCHKFMPVSDPESHLITLVNHFTKSPFTVSEACILPDLCWEFVTNEKGENQRLKKLNDIWEGGYFSSGLIENYYNKLLFGDENPIHNKNFNTLCEEIYSPIAEHWVEVEL
ncbi:MAG: exodeoxyribonuclease V subunit gamma [Balneolaceae bacterium]|nr:exodeoxyribonuclease V subunit gamma [Balneolaceae bacterium]